MRSLQNCQNFSKRTQRTSSLIHSTLKTPRILTIRFLDAIKNFTVLDELKSLKHQEFLQLNLQELLVLDGHQDVEHLEVLGVLKNRRFLRPRDFLKENLKVLQNALFKLFQ